MSNTIRSYSVSGGGGRKRKGGVRRILQRILLLVLIGGLGYAWWASRDTFTLGRLAPRESAYRVFACDILEKRQEIAVSQIWTLFPEGHVVHEAIAALSGDFGMPEWVLNNLIHDLVYVSGQDTTAFSDPLFMTRMSRIGCLLERFHQFAPGVEEDYAGGLFLRRLQDLNLFYAVRGRVLLLSPSRQALIHALTLSEAEALGESALRQAAADSEAKSLHGSTRLDPDSTLGAWFSEAQLALDVHSHHIRLVMQGLVRESLQPKLAPFFANAAPTTLKRPPEGMLSLSADFGKPVAEFADALLALGEEPWRFEDFLAQFIEIESPQGEALRTFLPLLWRQCGSGLRLSWTGVDVRAMLPVPELFGSIDVDPALIQECFTQIPAPPSAIRPWECYPRFDAESGVAWLPMIGGPSIEPSAALHGDSLLISSSHTLLTSALESYPGEEALNLAGNLYLRMQPASIILNIGALGVQLAELGLIKGHDLASFNALIEDWKEQTQPIREIAALAAMENQEALSLDFRMTLLE